jgi:hypothetical protein
MTTATKEDKAQSHYNIGWSLHGPGGSWPDGLVSPLLIYSKGYCVHSILVLLRLLKWIQWRCLKRFSTCEKENRNSLVFSNPLIPVGTSRIDHIRSFGQWPCATSASFPYGPSSPWFGPTTDVLNDLQWYTQLDGIYRDSQGRCPQLSKCLLWLSFFIVLSRPKDLIYYILFLWKGLRLVVDFFPFTIGWCISRSFQFHCASLICI